MYHSYENRRDFAELKGKAIVAVEGVEPESYEVTLTCDDGVKYTLAHDQDCCEHVCLSDIVGDPSDLIGTVVDAREESNSESFPDGVAEPEYLDSFTWTFYVIQTNRGCVTLRWLGTSNGYYSESVNLYVHAQEEP